jgi:hypothetical protein
LNLHKSFEDNNLQLLTFDVPETDFGNIILGNSHN